MRVAAWLRHSRAVSVSRGYPLKTAQDRSNSVRTATKMRQTGAWCPGTPGIRARMAGTERTARPSGPDGRRNQGRAARCATNRCAHKATSSNYRGGHEWTRKPESAGRLRSAGGFSAPRVGLEPTTLRVIAAGKWGHYRERKPLLDAGSGDADFPPVPASSQAGRRMVDARGCRRSGTNDLWGLSGRSLGNLDL